MAVRTNCTKNGSSYFRATASVGRDGNGKLIRKDMVRLNQKLKLKEMNIY